MEKFEMPLVQVLNLKNADIITTSDECEQDVCTQDDECVEL